MAPRVRVAVRALGVSLAAAAGGALLAGVVDAVQGGARGLAALVTIGLAALLAWPLATLALVMVRVAWAAWDVPTLVAELREPSGGAPRLAAWLIYGLLAVGGLLGATAGAVLVQSELTAFKPNVVAAVTPIIVLLAAAVLLTLSRPTVGLIAGGLRRLERRRPRAWLAPRVLGLGTVGLLATLTLVTGWFVVRPSLAYYDLAPPLFALTLTVGTAAAAVGLARLTRPRRLLVGGATSAVAGVAIGVAVVLLQTEPMLALRVWASEDVAASVVERVTDLDRVRDGARNASMVPVPKPGAAHPPVILITIDTVRADQTPLGGGAAKMPTLKELGSRSAVFTRAYAPGNVTRRSIPSIITGVSVPRLRGKVAGWALRMDPRHVMLPERFAAAGYATAGFMCCASFWSPEHKLGLGRGLAELTIERDGAKLAAMAADWIRARKDAAAPYFMWLHFIEPHGWATADVEDAGKLSKTARYQAVLAEVDEFLATLVDGWSAPGVPQPIVAITSDHGEGLGEHGARHHSSNLYESQVHVPLVLSGPGIDARRISEPVSGTSLAATLLDLAGFEPPGMPMMDGASIADLARGTQVARPDQGTAYIVMTQDRSVKTGARAIVRGRWKLIVTGAHRELYDVVANPREDRNRIDDEPAIAAELQALLAERAQVDAVDALVGWQ